ncbi:MAG: hypothetical protein IT561_07450 [Alphaproteobacteria bacterium]|nr:hypothetical protein [Alphaproteobacteria bacterium]
MPTKTFDLTEVRRRIGTAELVGFSRDAPDADRDGVIRVGAVKQGAGKLGLNKQGVGKQGRRRL